MVKLKDTHTGNTLCSPHAPGQAGQSAVSAADHPRLPSSHRQGRGGQSRGGPGGACTRRTRLFFIGWMRNCTRRLFPRRANCILKLSWTDCAAASTRTSNWASRECPYRETIKSPADSKYRHKKQTGGAGQFAEVWMRIEPLPRDSGVEFTESLSGQNVDRGLCAVGREGREERLRRRHPGRLQGGRCED